MMIRTPFYLSSLLPLLITASSVLAQAPDLIVQRATLNVDGPQYVGGLLNGTISVANVGDDTAAVAYVGFGLTAVGSGAEDGFVPAVTRSPRLAPGQAAELSFVTRVKPQWAGQSFTASVRLDFFEELTESNEANEWCFGEDTCTEFVVRDARVQGYALPYPILLVHGLASNSRTWDKFVADGARAYGWTGGGRLDYCLNPDGDQETSDGEIEPFVSGLTVGDIYRINFDVSNTGTAFVADDSVYFNDHHSDESAVTKQGWAVADAVARVREVTGAERVLLVAHSMGGLASRHYLQHADLWPEDGYHHVAKLVTVGTPHGGSNRDGGFLSNLLGIDDDSEAVRDLRYAGHDGAGQYLSGGFEWLNPDFHNADINCDSRVGIDNIVGLNQRDWPSDVALAAVAGVGRHLADTNYGDGMVRRSHADPGNYILPTPPLARVYTDLFEVNESHTALHQDHFALMSAALDEPGVHDPQAAPYALPLNSVAEGHVNAQAPTNTLEAPHNSLDYDLFHLALPVAGQLTVELAGAAAAEVLLTLLNADGAPVSARRHISAGDPASVSEALPAGDYFALVVSTTLDTGRLADPYYIANAFAPIAAPTVALHADATSVCEGAAVTYNADTTGQVSSLSWSFPGGTPATSTAISPTVTYERAGAYSATVAAANVAGTATAALPQSMIIEPAALASMSQPTVEGMTVRLSTGEHAIGETMTWDMGDGSAVVGTAVTYAYQQPGAYRVRLSATNDCGADTAEVRLEVSRTSGVLAAADATTLVYPNPTTGWLHIEWGDAGVGGPTLLTIADAAGRTVVREEARGTSAVLALGVLPKGAYVLRVTHEGSVGQHPIIIR